DRVFECSEIRSNAGCRRPAAPVRPGCAEGSWDAGLVGAAHHHVQSYCLWSAIRKTYLVARMEHRGPHGAKRNAGKAQPRIERPRIAALRASTRATSAPSLIPVDGAFLPLDVHLGALAQIFVERGERLLVGIGLAEGEQQVEDLALIELTHVDVLGVGFDQRDV